MKKLLFFIVIILLFQSIYSCSEQKKPSKLEELLNRIENGESTETTLDELIELTVGLDGTSTISVDSAHFKITFPITKPIESTTTQIIDGEQMKIHYYHANMQDLEDDNLGYSFDYMFISNIESEEEINTLFNAQRDYVLSATNGELEFEKVIDIDGVSGRHLYLTIDNSEIKTNYKIYYNNGVLYKLAVITPGGNLFNKSISKFFDSFEITE